MSIRNHHYRTEMSLPLPREQIFEFFTDVQNLVRITPPHLNFKVVTPLPIILKKGATIEARLKPFGGISITWLTQITDWNPPYEFSDKQLKGPNRLFTHTHRFIERNGYTIIEDDLIFSLPFWPFGEIAYPVVILQIKEMFAYRQKKIREILMSD